MADLRIVDAPEIPTENITGEEKLPTGGSGNYSISLDSLADYTKTKKDLVDNTSVDTKVNGVRQELNTHIGDLLNPHQVTKAQIGLGNVDNTADADKPVSNSTQAAIISAASTKADKTYVDGQLALKANKSDVYTKSETYTKQESSDLASSSISTALTPVNTSLDLVKRGIANRYDSALTYNSGERVVLANGDIVKSTVDWNVNDPNVDMTGWVKTNSASQVFTSDDVSLEVFSKLYRNNFVFITDPLFGAVGDGSDESAKVQAALDYVGEYGTIYVPRGTFFVPKGLQLKRGQTIQGFGAQSSILQGDGSNVVIKTNSSVSGSIRYLRLLSLGVDNFTRNSGVTGNYAVQWWAANDSHIQMCEIKSRFQEALHVKYSYRGSITRNRITTSASAWAFALLNNCNGMDCSNNTISGGQAGGGVRVGMSQSLNLSNSVIEVAGTCAVRVGGDDGADGGRCTGINLKGLYAEQCKRVLEAGLNFECYGIDIDGFIINQKSVSVIATYDEALHLGRVNGLFFQSGFAEGANQTAFIKLYDIAAGVGWTPYLSGSTLKSKAISGYLSPLFSFNGSTQSLSARIFGRNEIALNSDEIIGSEKEYISAPITCNIGYTNKIIIPPSLYGGMIQSVEIIEADASTGGISGRINIGSSAGATEVYTVDLSTVTLTSGYAKVVAESANKFIRATGLVMSVSVGTHTSSFRVRIKYRN